MALCKRVVRFGANKLAQVTALSAQGGTNSWRYFAPKFCKLNSFSSLPSNSNLRHSRVIDTLALVKALESEGVPSTQAKGVANAMAKVVNDTIEKNMANSSALKAELHKGRYSSIFRSQFEKIESDMNKMSSEVSDALDNCSHSITAGFEAVKYDCLKISVGAVFMSAVGIAVVKIYNIDI